MTVSALGKALAFCCGLIGFSLQFAAADELTGSFLCDLVKAPSGGPGFVLGDQIIVGASYSDLMWISNGGAGLSYECDRSGHILICLLKDGNQRVVMDTKDMSFMRAFATADGVYHESETWKCSRMALRHNK